MTDQEIRDDECAKIGQHLSEIADAFQSMGQRSMSQSIRTLSIAIGEMHVHRGIERPKAQVVSDIIARVLETR